MKKLILLYVLLCVVGVAFIAGCTQQAPSTPTPTPLPAETMAEETPAGVTGTENGTGTPAEVADTLVNEMIRAGSYRTFLDFVYLTGVNENLSGPGPYTIFVPLDERVEEYISWDRETEMRTYPEIDMRPLVLGHIVEGTYTLADFATPMNLTTLAGTSIEVATVGGNVTVNGISMATSDIEAGNGVVYGINGVLLPPNF